MVASLAGDYEANYADRRTSAAAASSSSSATAGHAVHPDVLYPPYERSQIRESWKHLMRWSRAWRTGENGCNVLERVEKVPTQHHLPASKVDDDQGHNVRGAQLCTDRGIWRRVIRHSNGVRIGTPEATACRDVAAP